MITWLLIGAGIGFILEGAGFGSPKKLTGVFLLKDWAVPQVMATAIVVAMAGGLVLTLAGQTIGYLPATRLAGQALGGFIFGLGFFVGGYCPGTSVVGAASGRVDALAFMAGMVGGWQAWPAIAPHVRSLLQKAEHHSLPQLLAIDHRVVAAVLAVGGGAVVFWLYRRSRRAGT